MKKAIAWMLVVALTAAIAVGGTLAYLTDTDEDTNVMTLGNVKIDQLEYERVDVETGNENAEVQEFHDNKPLYPAVTEDGFDYTPGDSYVDWTQIGKDGYTSQIWDPAKINNEVDKMVFVKNKGTYDAYVRSIFAFEAGKYTSLDEFRNMVHLNLNETDWTWDWQPTPVTIGESTYFVATATYSKILTPGALTEISLSQVALDAAASNADVEAFGDTYQVLVKTQGVQTAGFPDADTALKAGFGAVDTDNIPWENDAPTRGTDLRTALHYLDGDTDGTKITAKVTNLVFGLNKDHADIVNNYTGTLVDVGQDVPVYAYYVPNGSSYDVYFLANDKIYTPEDCSNLCNGMSALTTVDTGNLDVSRTTSMYRMFRDCASLKEIDVSSWNTANVTNMRDLFRGCKSVPALEVSGWDVSKVETMLAMFQDCVLITELDLSNWDVSQVRETTQMFNRCNKLQTLRISNWDTRSLSTCTAMFQYCTSLTALDLSRWNTSSLRIANGMFNHCENLTSLDVSTWDMSKATDISLMFQCCYKLNELDLSQWDTSSAVNLSSMFYSCSELISLNVGSWDVSKVQSFRQMFAYCHKLENLYGLGNWKTSSATDINHILADCQKLKELDLSCLDTRNVTVEMRSSFSGIVGLEKLVLGENVVFAGKGALTEDKQMALPAPAAKAGHTAKWRNVETGELFLASEIPEKTAATYEAYYEPIATA